MECSMSERLIRFQPIDRKDTKKHQHRIMRSELVLDIGASAYSFYLQFRLYGGMLSDMNNNEVKNWKLRACYSIHALFLSIFLIFTIHRYSFVIIFESLTAYENPVENSVWINFPFLFFLSQLILFSLLVVVWKSAFGNFYLTIKMRNRRRR